MSKRRLTEQQRRRIAARQQRLEAESSEDLSANRHPGLVVANYSKSFDIETDNGDVMRCRARNAVGDLVVGDRVLWQWDEQKNSGIIQARQERQSILARPDRYKGQKEIAANIDQIVVVITAVPQPIPYYLDKYLVIAEHQNIPVAIVLNKMDLLDSSCSIGEALQRDYQALGYRVLTTSAKSEAGIQDLVALLKDKTSILVGRSGVGKSALTNALFGKVIMPEGEVSEANQQKGRHTTVASQLLHLPFGGDIIDSPGIREFGLWHLDLEHVVECFVEFQEYLGYCKFRNCQHQNEKGCAIMAAVEQGQISDARYQSFLRVLAEQSI